MPWPGPEDARVFLRGLETYFRYLMAMEGVVYPWATALLADEEIIFRRWESFPHEHHPDGPEGVRWRLPLFEDLEARLFIPAAEMTGGGKWIPRGRPGDPVPAEDTEELDLLYGLYDELERRWLYWRDQVIAAGITEPGRVRTILVRRQQEWETRPHPGLRGLTPAEALQEAKEDMG